MENGNLNFLSNSNQDDPLYDSLVDIINSIVFENLEDRERIRLAYKEAFMITIEAELVKKGKAEYPRNFNLNTPLSFNLLALTPDIIKKLHQLGDRLVSEISVMEISAKQLLINIIKEVYQELTSQCF